jgi:thiosulfate dehydrogenase (quinone) large subunit
MLGSYKNRKLVTLFLRLTISASFLSAVADRFGGWSADVSAWGNWINFLKYIWSGNGFFNRNKRTA